MRRKKTKKGRTDEEKEKEIKRKAGVKEEEEGEAIREET